MRSQEIKQLGIYLAPAKKPPDKTKTATIRVQNANIDISPHIYTKYSGKDRVTLIDSGGTSCGVDMSLRKEIPPEDIYDCKIKLFGVGAEQMINELVEIQIDEFGKPLNDCFIGTKLRKGHYHWNGFYERV